MGKKRKRPAREPGTQPSLAKRVQVASKPSRENQATHPVISRYYRRVLTLRQYLLEQLPSSSKSRRRRIASLGRQGADTPRDHDNEALSTLLDSTLVGVLREPHPKDDKETQKHLAAFTQSQYKSSLASTDTGPFCLQSEIVDFVIRTLFNRVCFSHHTPRHILAHGYQRTTTHNLDSTELGALASSIPGIVARYPNPNVLALKRAPWTEVLDLMGQNGEEIMLRLLLDCGIFSCMDNEKGAFYQLSGIPLSELELDPKQTEGQRLSSDKNPSQARGAPVLHKPNSIIFCRRRMLYARVALNAQAHVRFGLKHTHVLNRFPLADCLSHTVHVMKYIFPRQFGLHNVFTSSVDSRETAFPYKDYTFREEEIGWIEGRKSHRVHPSAADEEEAKSVQDERRPKIPKRLRGKAVELVQKLQKGNQRCPYTKLLDYYCPIEQSHPPCFSPNPSHDPSSQKSEQLVTQLNCPSPSLGSNDLRSEPPLESLSQLDTNMDQKKQKLCLTDYATPASSVSAFCRAVLQKLVANGFYGVGQEGQWNRQIILKNVDRFIRLRRFESISLHQVCMGLKVSSIPWMEVRNQQGDHHPTQQKLCLTDLQKRTELLHELVYYIFDSLLVPIIRSHFYVTESQMHRNRLFYFRHDIWRMLSADPLAHLKSSMLEEMKRDKAEQILKRRSLGYSTLRLLPKGSGARPIVNLRRRTVKMRTGRKMLLAPSINSILAPLSSVLNYEKAAHPGIFGAGMNSVSDLLPRLQAFKDNFHRESSGEGSISRDKRLYFVKLDVQSCFDTIPQSRLIALMEELVANEAYCVTKQVQIKPAIDLQQGKPVKKFGARAAPVNDPTGAPATRAIRSNAVLVDTGRLWEHSKEDLLDLLEEHIRRNIIKIGKKYFRQKNGIPQGSVLSSNLCNFFYGRLEQEVLGFLSGPEAVLFRLIDDFLLITWDSKLAMRFLELMVRGQPDYGVTVNPEKSLVNFEASIDGVLIPRLIGSRLAYCGMLIDTYTLEIQRDRDRLLTTGDPASNAIADSLTVEVSQAPGYSFNKKILGAFPSVFRAMFMNTMHNSFPVVLSNLYATFADWAMRMYQYLKSLSKRTRPSSTVIIRTIRDVITLATKLSQSRQGTKRETVCNIKRAQAEYLAAAAFRFVLGRKQTQFSEVLHWLELVGKSARPTTDREAVLLRKAVKNGERIFEGWRF
ncbi:hypothetical protein DTO271D3_5664 [Paecilomyces variotii]|nr:hypothetical protein DTO169E5_9215 [Paecilomyces variotii]KAJ9314187.1 hypothetical protein DTO271D3_5664 [Paecilomyces variotii]